MLTLLDERNQHQAMHCEIKSRELHIKSKGLQAINCLIKVRKITDLEKVGRGLKPPAPPTDAVLEHRLNHNS